WEVSGGVSPPTGDAGPVAVRRTASEAGHSSGLLHARVSADGKRAATCDSTNVVRLWALEGGLKELPRLKGGRDRRCFAVGLWAGGRRLVTGGLDKSVRLWDVDGGAELSSAEGLSGPAYHVDLSPDGKRILAAGSGPEAVLYDADCKEVLRLRG